MATSPVGTAHAESEDPRVVRSRALLIDAATRLLAEGGVEAVTIDAVTRTAGVARTTLYRHFGTGTELLAAAFEQLLPPVPPPVAPAAAQGSLRHRLLTLVSNQAQLIDHAPLHLTVLSWLGMGVLTTEPDAQPQTDRPRLRALRRRIIEQYRQPFETILTGADARAALRPDTAVATALAQLVGPVVFNRLVTGLPNTETFCARVVDDFLAANTQG